MKVYIRKLVNVFLLIALFLFPIVTSATTSESKEDLEKRIKNIAEGYIQLANTSDEYAYTFKYLLNAAYFYLEIGEKNNAVITLKKAFDIAHQNEQFDHGEGKLLVTSFMSMLNQNI